MLDTCGSLEVRENIFARNNAEALHDEPVARSAAPREQHVNLPFLIRSEARGLVNEIAGIHEWMHRHRKTRRGRLSEVIRIKHEGSKPHLVAQGDTIWMP